MSEGKYVSVDLDKRTIQLANGRRYQFSKRAVANLGCKLTDLEKGIPDAQEFQKLWNVIISSRFYKWKIEKDEKGSYFNIRSATEDTQRLKTQPLDGILDEMSEISDSPFLVLDPEQEEQEQREKRRSRTTTSRDIMPIIKRAEYIKRDERSDLDHE